MSQKLPEGNAVATDSSTPKGNIRKLLMVTLAALFLVGGVAIMVAGMQPSSQTSPVSAPVVTMTDSPVTHTPVEDSPSAAPPPSTEPYVEVPVLAETPVEKPVTTAPAPAISYPASTLNVPSVGISTSIVSGGETNGSMVLPDSSMVAEFSGAAALTSPKGSTVIAGHVNFADGSEGAIGPLYRVENGAPVYATDAAGVVHEYKVTNSTVLHKQALPADLFRTAGPKQLVLVTCGGALEAVNGVLVYTHNQVVIAEAV